jgi:hypothetical protein
VRVSSDYRFWDPADNYGERADAWAQYDFKALVEFLKRSAREQGGGGPETYYLSIERSGGIKKFWEERPPEAPKNAAVEAAGPLPD